MGEFSAHTIRSGAQGDFIITTALNLYVSTDGSDENNAGLSVNSPWKTPQKALEWLSNKIIAESGFVTINFAAGIYNIDETILIDHPNGERIAFVGAQPETLLLQEVSYYATRGFTADGMSGFYSGVFHGITMNCVRYDTSTNHAAITAINQIKDVCREPGSGVIVEDYDLVNRENYPVYAYYASYPKNPRNNLTRQGAILGCHKLLSAQTTNGQLEVESTIRDDWFALPQIDNPIDDVRFYGNPAIGQTYANGSCANPSDTTETQTNSWLLPITNNKYGQYIGSVPVGYYGTNSTTGTPIGSTSNFIGGTFPTAATYVYLKTNGQPFEWNNNPGVYLYSGLMTGRGITANITFRYSFTGPNGSMLNSAANTQPTFHEHIEVSGLSAGASASWRSVNTSRVTVTIIPTVFRRHGTIMSIKGSGLRKIKNIFFDGVLMPSFYALIGDGSSHNGMNGYSSKSAISISRSKIGTSVSGEPAGLGDGLCSNVGIKDFQVGVHASRNSDVLLGSVAISNCAYAIISNNGSSMRTTGSISTGCMHGFNAANDSLLEANRCFSSFSGQSLMELQITSAGNSFGDSAFNPGQTFQNGPIRGTVYHWNPSNKLLTLAVKVGQAEGRRL